MRTVQRGGGCLYLVHTHTVQCVLFLPNRYQGAASHWDVISIKCDECKRLFLGGCVLYTSRVYAN